MSRLEWDKTGSRYYETGVKNGVLYPQVDGEYTTGVAWNGLTNITEKPTGAEATALYADDIKYLNLISNEDFEASIEAYTYPDEFAACDGSVSLAPGVSIGQQKRNTFGLCYRTSLGNDNDGVDYGYKLHIIYGCIAAPSEKAYSTINDSPEAITFSWEIKTTPVSVTGKKPTASLVIDSSTVTNATALKKIEGILYGADAYSTTATYSKDDVVENDDKLYICTKTTTTAGEFDSDDWSEIGAAGARLPLPDEIATLFASVG